MRFPLTMLAVTAAGLAVGVGKGGNGGDGYAQIISYF